MANSSAKYKRCTVNSIPNSAALFNRCKLPMGLILVPFRNQMPNEAPIPLVSSPQIVRCRRCRTYINPFVTFIEQGTRWKCNMCFLGNEGNHTIIKASSIIF